MKKNLRTAVLLGLACGLVTVGAQAATFELDPVVVTATRTELELSKVPANVSLITQTQLENKHYKTLEDAIRRVPGVASAVYQPVGFTENNNFYINGSKDVVLMVDGVRLNSIGINPQVTAMYDMDNIERIEVLKGAGSSLYGANAKGGVINIITKKPQEGKLHGGIEVNFGNFGQEKYRLHAEGRSDKLSLGIELQKNGLGDFKDGDGVLIPRALDAKNYGIRLGYDVDEHNEFKFRYSKYDAKEMYSNWIWGEWGQERNKINWDTAIFEYDWSSDEDNIKNHFTFSYNHYHSQNSLNEKDIPSWQNDVITRSFQNQITYLPNEKHTLVAGLEYTKAQPKSKTVDDFITKAIYIQDEWQVTPELKFIPGIRYDTTNKYGSATSPHFILQYEMNTETNIYVGYSKFFVPPTPEQILPPYGDPTLKSETGKQLELGINHKFAKQSLLAANVFKRKTNNFIAWLGSGFGNVTEEVQGVQVEYNGYFADHWGVRLGYTYTDTNSPASYIPRHVIDFGVTYDQIKWNAYVDMLTKIKVGWETNPLPHDTYTVVNVGANYRFDNDVSVYGKISNLLDKSYAEVSNVQYGGPGQWYMAEGRSYQLGVNIKF